MEMINVKMATEDKKGYYFFMVVDSSGCAMPKEIIFFKPSSTDILRGCVSFSGSIKRNPVVGLGEVGTKIFSIFSSPEIPSGVLQQTIPKVFKGSLG